MKKKILFVLLGMTIVFAASGCSKEENKSTTAVDTAEDSTEDEAAADADMETEEDIAAEEDTEAATEETLSQINPPDYLIENVSDYVTLGEVRGLTATQYTYEITDEMVQSEIENELSSYAEEIEADRASKAGDIVYCDLTSTVEGEDPQTESTYFVIGDEEYGTEFDEQLTGVSVDDKLDFQITFGDDIWMDEWIGQTVSFDITVTSICEQSIPEYNDEFVAEYTDYASMDEYETAIRTSLESQYAENSYSDTLESLIESAMAVCEFKSYPQELFDSSKQDLLDFYSLFTGTSEEEDIYELFDITSEELDAEVMDSVNRSLLISAICEENGLQVTPEEYYSYVEEYADAYGYSSAAEFEEENTRESLVLSLYDTKAGEFLYENAEITEEAASAEEEFEEDWDEDAEEGAVDTELEEFAAAMEEESEA